MFDNAKLAALIEQAGWKQVEIARQAGITPQQLHKLLAGEKRDPSTWTLQRLAHAGGWRLEQLVNNDPPKPRAQPKKAKGQRREKANKG